MARSDADVEAPAILAKPQISLIGEVDKFMVEKFLDQLGKAEQTGGDVALEITTLGGDPEMARRIVLEIDRARARLSSQFVFLGKTVVYSAGATIMSAFPRKDRWLTPEATVMIHCRKLEKTLELSGPIRSSVPLVEGLLAQLKVGIASEREPFCRLIEGSDIGEDEIWEKALHNWYLDADEALSRGMVAGIYRN